MWQFEVVAIEKTQPPMPEHNGNWYQYTIANHITEITGVRRGSRSEVLNFAKSSIERLNTRHKAPAFSQS
jgi:hypothetical protein